MQFYSLSLWICSASEVIGAALESLKRLLIRSFQSFAGDASLFFLGLKRLLE